MQLQPLFALLKKELQVFFGTAAGYAVLGMFFVINGLLLWVLETNFNILNSGFADLRLFFSTTPWLLVFLIPALSMRSFTEEFQKGTLEILKTKPLPNWQLIGGKFLALRCLLFLTLLPTLTYVLSLYFLALPEGNIDLGSILGSYLGLYFLGMTFCSIGLWTATLSKNPLIVLLLGTGSLFASYYGPELLGHEFPNHAQKIEKWGLYARFSSLSKGVLDTRDLLCFVGTTVFFLGLILAKTNPSKPKKWAIYASGLLLVWFLGNQFYGRFDLTSDQRFQLSSTSKQVVQQFEKPVFIRVYLEGVFPPEFRRLRAEIEDLLEELKNENKELKVFFTNPQDDLQRLVKLGMTPSRLTVREKGNISETVVLPWATVEFENKRELVSLLKDSTPLESQESQLNASIQNLEYAFVAALKKAIGKKEKKIAVLRGNGELGDLHLFSLLKTLGNQYHLSEFTLDSVKTTPQKTLMQLNRYDLLLIAKPTEAFSEAEKYTLDQYTLQGGNSIWLVDAAHAEMDSLSRTGTSTAYPRRLNLDDFFFRYGARLKQNLVQDLYAAKITLATGNRGNKTVFQSFLWPYHPLVRPQNLHPISKNMGPLRLQFASSIDTLKNDIQKTILIKSSPLSRKVSTPLHINLQSVAEQLDPKNYQNGGAILGLLLEGSFDSAYLDRQKPFEHSDARNKGKPAKIILLSDGDFASNPIKNGRPMELGINQWTQEFYDNKAFLLNAVDYLLDDRGLLSLRSKNFELPLLNKEKIQSERLTWQCINLMVPLLFTALLGSGVAFFRKRRYGRKITGSKRT